MDQEFITIGEAARLLKQADSAVMLLIKKALLAGTLKEDIMKSEMREGRMMYLISRTFLIKESAKEKEAPVAKEASREAYYKKEEEPVPVASLEDDMIATLKKVIDTKDQQIGDLSGKIDQLIERDHETNILLKGLHDRLFLLEQGKSQEGKRDKEKEK
ncbi:MAG: hypothetical protein O3C23_01200 [bacterium]|nr:hypothetical protein [bacterium]